MAESGTLAYSSITKFPSVPQLLRYTSFVLVSNTTFAVPLYLGFNLKALTGDLDPSTWRPGLEGVRHQALPTSNTLSPKPRVARFPPRHTMSALKAENALAPLPTIHFS